MKKYFTLLLISLSIISQKSNAQLSPALVDNFAINVNFNSDYKLSWDVANNEVISSFEVEQSFNGKDFTSIAVIMPTEKKGADAYKFSGVINSTSKVMFRLKIINKARREYYSKILFTQAKKVIDNKVKIIGNPVNDKLTLSYTSQADEISIKILNLSGKILHSQKINNSYGSNMISIPLNTSFTPGLYVVEINNGIENKTEKFIKL